MGSIGTSCSRIVTLWAGKSCVPLLASDHPFGLRPVEDLGYFYASDLERFAMDIQDMRRLFLAHRDAEARRDYDGILETFTTGCYLETVPLAIRSEGYAATRAAYLGYFAAFPDLSPTDEGFAYGNDTLVAWGHLQGTSRGEWFGVPPSGRSFRVPFTNLTRFANGRMAGESLYFDLATLCEQAALPLEQIRTAARTRARAGSVTL